MEVNVREYIDSSARSPFKKWFDSLSPTVAAKVAKALYMLEQANWSNVKSLGGGVHEYRITFGPGYRIYFGKQGAAVVILLGGGTKKRQSKDIEEAKFNWMCFKSQQRNLHQGELMALTRDFRETILSRAQNDLAFRRAMLEEAVNELVCGDLQLAKRMLRDYINATISFKPLGKALDKSSKNLQRMLSASGNPTAKSLFEILHVLQENEGVQLKIQVSKSH